MECAVSRCGGYVGSRSSTFVGIKNNSQCIVPVCNGHTPAAKQAPLEVTCRRKQVDQCRRPVRQPDVCYRPQPQQQPQQPQQQPQQQPPRNDYARLASVGRGGSTEGPGTEWYTVQPGDSLFGIAVDRDVTVYDIRDLNGMPAGSSTVLPGQKLLVPALAPAAAAGSKGGVAPLVQEAQAAWKSSLGSLQNAWSQATHQKYKVVAGDTLSGIAVAKGVPMAELIHFNRLSLPLTILEGQTLLLPRWSQPASSSSSGGSSASGVAASSSAADAGVCGPKPAADVGRAAATSAIAPPSQWSSLWEEKTKAIQLPSPTKLVESIKWKKSIAGAGVPAESAASDTCAAVCSPSPAPARKPLITSGATPLLGASIVVTALLAAATSGKLQPALQQIGGVGAAGKLLQSLKSSLAEIESDSAASPAGSPASAEGQAAAALSQAAPAAAPASATAPAETTALGATPAEIQALQDQAAEASRALEEARRATEQLTEQAAVRRIAIHLAETKLAKLVAADRELQAATEKCRVAEEEARDAVARAQDLGAFVQAINNN